MATKCKWARYLEETKPTEPRSLEKFFGDYFDLQAIEVLEQRHSNKQCECYQ